MIMIKTNMRKLFLISILFLPFGCKFNNPETDKVKFKYLIFNRDSIEQDKRFLNWKNINIDCARMDSHYSQIAPLKLKDSENKYGLYPLPSMFHDSLFNVYSICMGEFGGGLYFVDKKDSNNCYCMRSTCPIMIDKVNGVYYVTETLAHGFGFVRIIEIKNPKALLKIKRNDFLKLLSIDVDYHLSPKQSQILDSNLHNQGQILLDTSGDRKRFLFLDVFYPYHNKYYLIMTSHENTFLALLENRKMQVIDTIVNFSSRSHGDFFNFKKNNIYCYKFINWSDDINCNYGSIYVKADTIVVGYGHEKQENMETKNY